MHYFFNSYDSKHDKTLTGAASTSKICLLRFSSKCRYPGDLTGIRGRKNIFVAVSLPTPTCEKSELFPKYRCFLTSHCLYLPNPMVFHSSFLPPSLHPSFLPSFLSSLSFPLYFYFSILKSNLGHCTCWANILPLICIPNSDFYCFSIMAPTINIW